MAVFARQLAQRYGSFLKEKPYVCNMINGGLLALGGDAICQLIVEKETLKTFNWRRAYAVTVFGTLYQGALCTRLYQHFPTMLPKYFTATRMRTGVGCTLLDNFLHVPFLYMPAYFGAVGALQGDSMETTMTVMRRDFADAVWTCWFIWIPAQTITFSVVPHHLRVLFVSAGCLVWNAVLDYLSHRHNHPADHLIITESASAVDEHAAASLATLKNAPRPDANVAELSHYHLFV